MRLRFGESISEAVTPLGIKGACNDHAVRDFTVPVPLMSDQCWGETGFRFVYIELQEPNAALSLRSVLAVYVRRETAQRGTFSCSDPLLDRIFDTAAYTCRLCMQGLLWDGIKRDRLVWIGDSHPEMLAIRSLFGADPVLERSLDDICACTPLPGWMNGMPSYSLWWLCILHDWYRYTGDRTYPDRHRAYVQGLVDQILGCIDDDGTFVIDGYFLDWPSEGTPAAKDGVHALLLVALDAARGRYISGQELAAQLGVSRTAVWKAVAALRRDGIPIKAVTNRGYTLAQSVDVLNAAAVAAQLDEATVKALQIEVVDRLPGTNAALRSRADAGAREGLVLIAQAQSAGRGRGGHSFYSPPGGLYMSILLRPEIGARQAVGLTAMAAVAAARAAERLCGVPITIKWVNDLWKNGKKVCGILTEAALDLESGMLDYAVLGLGFNVAAPADGWPEDLRDVAGALYDGSPAPGARAALAAAFLNAFWPLYRAGPRSGYLDEYRRRQALTGQRVLVTPRRGTPRAAQVQGIDDECKLVVRFDGESRPAALNSGEVSVRLL